jgi:hypothetical protein
VYSCAEYSRLIFLTHIDIISAEGKIPEEYQRIDPVVELKIMF